MTDSRITLALHADDPDGLAELVQKLAQAFGGVPQLADHLGVVATATNPLDGKSSLTAEVQPAGKRRAKTKAEPEAESPVEAAPEIGLPVESPGEAKNESTPDVAGSVVGASMSPRDMIDDTIKKLMAHYGKNPGITKELAELQNRFGVKLFKDIPDERAREFVAAAQMLLNGTGEVK